MSARCAIALSLLLWPVLALAEQTAELTAAYRAQSGRADIDAGLSDINYYVERHPDAFVDELHHASGVGRAQLRQWLAQPQRQAADVYFACQLGALLQLPCLQLLQARDAAGEGDWEAALAAQELRLGTAQWRQLRQRFQHSYRVWARPLPAALGKA
ncbi:hypothetical protein [Stenotrophomonas ginsengisoli]|uniref:hypothetical protein n=1 Tax=Stenotrophomonas ginsengisoli TaxID=336566 RepID=UPI000708B612|nr:hypothetical protein [Stenotrophomonas ginsengisoli]